jgi:hypothetical protein
MIPPSDTTKAAMKTPARNRSQFYGALILEAIMRASLHASTASCASPASTNTTTARVGDHSSLASFLRASNKRNSGKSHLRILRRN